MKIVNLSYEVRQPKTELGTGFVICRVNGGQAFTILAFDWLAFFVKTGLVSEGAAIGCVQVPAELVNEAALHNVPANEKAVTVV